MNGTKNTEKNKNMISEEKIRKEAERLSDSRLNGHDVSAFIRGAKWMCREFGITITTDDATADSINIEEFKNGGSSRVVVFRYDGDGDPVVKLEDKIREYTKNEKFFNEFVGVNMDNPWVRVVIFSKV